MCLDIKYSLTQFICGGQLCSATHLKIQSIYSCCLDWLRGIAAGKGEEEVTSCCPKGKTNPVMGLIITITHRDVVCEGIQGIFASYFFCLLPRSQKSILIPVMTFISLSTLKREGWMIGGDHPSPDSFCSCKHFLSCSVCSYQAIRADISLRHWAI